MYNVNRYWKERGNYRELLSFSSKENSVCVSFATLLTLPLNLMDLGAQVPGRAERSEKLRSRAQRLRREKAAAFLPWGPHGPFREGPHFSL